ncbi:hypothetical protein ABT186_23150 [Streptomyces sp. NPDC001634]|uniref:hypothetical protein n=1 Tax=Streptomyces sp. NPDC001634 TaxID=3154390 RepID=UPI00331FEBBA
MPFGEYGQDDDGGEEVPYATGGTVSPPQLRARLDEPVVPCALPPRRLAEALRIMSRR